MSTDIERAKKARKIGISWLIYFIQTPYRLSYFLCLSRFLLSETASSRLFLFIIFSFQNFRYHSGIMNGYQCAYWYYDSAKRNVQELFTFCHNTSYTSFLTHKDMDHSDISSFLHSQHFHPIH